MNVPAGSAGEAGPSALRWLWLSLAIIALDQATKAVIVANFELFERHALLPMLEITRLHNKGAAFSMLSDASGWQQYFFLTLALAVSVAIAVWLRVLKLARSKALASGLSLIVGGALGNAIDRVARGHVVDFIHVHWFESWYFPAFNVADSAITVGACLVILDALLDYRRTPPAAPPPGTT